MKFALRGHLCDSTVFLFTLIFNNRRVANYSVYMDILTLKDFRQSVHHVVQTPSFKLLRFLHLSYVWIITLTFWGHVMSWAGHRLQPPISFSTVIFVTWIRLSDDYRKSAYPFLNTQFYRRSIVAKCVSHVLWSPQPFSRC